MELFFEHLNNTAKLGWFSSVFEQCELKTRAETDFLLLLGNESENLLEALEFILD